MRFEDEEVVDENKRSGTADVHLHGGGKSSLRMMSVSSGRGMGMGRDCSSARVISRSVLKSSIPKPDSFDLDEPVVDESPPETTDEDESESKSPVPKNPVQFKSTFPIDAPFGSIPRPTSLLRTSKVSTVLGRTFPIDKKCCDLNHPCDEHDCYQNNSCNSSPSSSSSALLLLPSTSNSAGPNFKGQEKVSKSFSNLSSEDIS